MLLASSGSGIKFVTSRSAGYGTFLKVLLYILRLAIQAYHTVQHIAAHRREVRRDMELGKHLISHCVQIFKSEGNVELSNENMD